MSEVITPAREKKSVAALADYLGPAVVLSIEGAEAVTELPDGTTVRTAFAFAYPYSPTEGDILLVIGRGTTHYAIGVLQGAGHTTLTFQGDVDLRAEAGTLRLWAERGIELGAPELTIQVERLKTIASTVTQKLGTFVQRVQSLWSVQARQIHTIAEDSTTTQAKSATIVTEETVTINGKQVHLG